MNENETQKVEDLYQAAEELYDQQRFGECLNLLDQALQINRSNAYLYHVKGDTLYEMKAYWGAATSYVRALRNAPDLAAAAMNLGNTYYLLKQYEKSLKQYDHVAQLIVDNGHISYNRGNTLAGAGMLLEAVESYSRSIELLPDFAGSYLNRANTLARLMRNQEALADYRHALALAPEDSNIAWTMAWAYFGKEFLTDIDVRDLERIARIDPGHYTSALCLAVSALQGSDMPGALYHLERAVQLEKDEWDPHFWTGFLSAMQGETEIARQAIETALDMGLPPLLLTPLYWLQSLRPEFFEQYAEKLLQQFGI